MGTTVIDELVVILGLDPTKFTEGQKKTINSMLQLKGAAQKNAKDIETWGKQSAEAVGLVRNSILRLAAAYVGLSAIKRFTADTTAAVAAQGRLAYNIGATTHEVALWQAAVKLLGGSGEAAGQSMQSLQQSLQQFALTGESSIVPYFRSIGVALTDIDTGKIRDISAIYLDLADKFSKMTPQQANFIGRAIGLDQGTINLLERGRPVVQQYLDMAEKAGAANDAQAATLQKLQTSWENFAQALTTVGREILTTAAPAIDKALDAVTDTIEKHKKRVEAGTAATGVGAAVGTIVGLIFGSAATGTAAGAALGAGAAGTASALSDVNNQLAPYGVMMDLEGNMMPVEPSAAPGSGHGSVVVPFPKSGISLFDLIQRLEGSGPGAVSPKGAVGKNQIMPATAAQYGFDPSRLGDPAYNDMVARAIESNLSARYHGDVDAISVAYNAGPGVADRWLASGRNASVLPAETQAYLARERALTGGGATASTTSVSIQNINVYTKATDAGGIARGIRGAVNSELVTQANQGPQ